MTATPTESRLAWVDVAKGICIILVVMMHSTLGVEKAIGSPSLLNTFIEWARPFRMPDFFLISGLFLAARINRPWPSYLDTKVVHFVYFYVLWLTIQFVFRAPGLIADQGVAGAVGSYLMGYIQPWGTLWFIYMLAVFFVTAKLVESAGKPIVLAGAALLHVLAPHTGWLAIDEFADRFVFFYTGYAAAPLVFAFADRVGRRAVPVVLAALAAWAGFNWLAVNHGIAFVKGPDLIASYIGIAAVVALSVILVATHAGRALAYCGRNSISIYLAFTLFMGPVRVALLKFAGWLPPEAVALDVTIAGVAGALVLHRIVSETRFDFLFVRPAAFKLPALRARFDGWRASRASAATIAQPGH